MFTELEAKSSKIKTGKKQEFLYLGPVLSGHRVKAELFELLDLPAKNNKTHSGVQEGNSRASNLRILYLSTVLHILI